MFTTRYLVELGFQQAGFYKHTAEPSQDSTQSGVLVLSSDDDEKCTIGFPFRFVFYVGATDYGARQHDPGR